jgi:SAM-dependent methyltransferase
MEDLAAREYIRQRVEPRPGDPFYLHLSDLVLAVRDLIPSGSSRVLDFGCGGSPYRPFFEPCTYHRADLAGADALDFQYGADSRLPAAASDYDCVLSSQVLEHVYSPSSYLSECYRVLRPGGRLILSTHGLFEDHSCPDDYWRWTAFGLRRLVEEAGFTIEKMKKLTTGPRAAVFFAERELYRLNFTRGGLYSQMLSYGTRFVRRTGARRRHEACDANFPHHRVVEAEENGHDIYIAIALTARRSISKHDLSRVPAAPQGLGAAGVK